MTQTHTPGPWAFDDQSSPLVYSRANGGNPYIAQVFSYTEGETGTLRPTAHADALLIAAAPELLVALQALSEFFVGRYVDDPRSDDEIDAAREKAERAALAAIAKATGNA